MTNADKFKSLFGLYATELWAMPEKDFLKWLNSEAMNCSEFPNNSDTISRQAAIDTLENTKTAISENGERYIAKQNAIMRIDALPSAQPELCEDAVSRVGAISHFRAIADATCPKEKYNEGFVDGLEFCIAHLSTMPSVTPEQRTGKWNRLDMDTLNCNKCGATFVLNQGSEKMHFCPNCRADMRGEQNG